MYRYVYRNSISVPSKFVYLNSHRKFSLINNNKLVSQLYKSSNLTSGERLLPTLSINNEIHIRSGPNRKDAESKVEKISNLLKDKKKGSTETLNKIYDEDVSKKITSPMTQSVGYAEKKQVDVVRPSLWDRLVKEVKHYYNGFKLLFLETRICIRLLKMVLNGHVLTRRERKQFTRTSADLFRLVPFSLFIIIPFMELALPIFIKIFPNMLPSTFNEASKEKEAMRKRLLAKLEMAKFLQDTLEETAMSGTKNKKSDELSQKFQEFMIKVRTGDRAPTNEEILKYSSLFENELTLDNLTRQQLIALCQILDVSTLANIPPNHILRFQLRMKIRSLETDDKMIIKEGIDKLDISELQQACRDRGMRAMGLSTERLKLQLQQWLDLHIKQNIPISLLLFSRSLYLPENLPTEDVIKTTLSALPKTIQDATAVKIAEMSGTKVDNTVRLELLKQEETQIKIENDEQDDEEKQDEKKSKLESTVKPIVEQVPSRVPEVNETTDLSDLNKSEILLDKAQILDDKSDSKEILTPGEIREISKIIDNLPSSQKDIISDEIHELKKDVDEYKEDVKEVEELSSFEIESRLTETKSAKILSNRVQKLINDMDYLVLSLEDKITPVSEANKMISVEQLMANITQIRGQADESKDKKLMDILKSLDSDNDGKIKDMVEIIKVFDIIEQENVKVTKSQLGKLVTLLQKEKVIEFEEELQELQRKQQETVDSKSSAEQK